MNRIVVDVPNEKLQAFEEAMNALGIERIPDNDIPEEQKNLVRRIVAESKDENYRDWDEVFREIRNRK